MHPQKALQAQAAVCACLKYFGNVIIGVARPEDKALMTDMVCCSMTTGTSSSSSFNYHFVALEQLIG